MTLTIEQFQKDATPWLEKMKQTGETLVLLSGPEAYEMRAAGSASTVAVIHDFKELLPKRDLIVGDPEELVHIDWSPEWRP